MGTVRVESPGDGVRLVTLDDPDRRNALGADVRAAVHHAVTDLRDDVGARVIVFTGAGKAFCAGADVPELFGDPARGVAETRAVLEEFYGVFLAVAALPQPTIAAVNGAAIGAGLNLALACDVRIAGPDAGFGATFSRIGLHPGGGCTWFLVRAMGASRALRTLLLGEVIGADAAVALGLADGPQDDCVAAAVELAGRFAAVDPGLARQMKRAVSLAVAPGDFATVLEYETWAQAASVSSPQVQAYVDRFRQ